MKKILILMGLILVFGTSYSYEMIRLVESPTAGMLQKGESEISTKMYNNNGLIVGASVGLFPRFMFGVNYGGEQLVGNQKPIWHDRVEFNAKLRVLDESNSVPALALGYNSQGHGVYHKGYNRYDIKSKGFYAVASKNYFLLGNLGLHFGANYTLETDDDDNEVNLFAGLDKSIGNMVTFLLEFDPGWNDNDDWKNHSIKGLGHGYLNGAVNIHFTDFLIAKISFFDMLENRENTQGSDRTLSLFYKMSF